MPALTVQIIRFVDGHFPGFVECVFEDADGATHVFVEKVPVVSRQELLATTSYPRAGTLDCERESVWKDAAGRSLARINTGRPWGVTSSSGETRFVVLASQLTG
jgi:hypothetical protein